MAFSFSIRVVNSDGDPRQGVEVFVSEIGILGLGWLEKYTDEDGWAEFDWPEGWSTTFEIIVDHEKQGEHSLKDRDTLSFTVDA